MQPTAPAQVRVTRLGAQGSNLLEILHETNAFMTEGMICVPVFFMETPAGVRPMLFAAIATNVGL